MIKRTISYIDYNDNPRTDEYFFHLNKNELLEMNFSVEGGMEAALKRIIKDDDAGKFLDILKDFILRSYGEKTEDGKAFIKVRNGHRLAEDFMQTPAYSELYMELLSDETKAINFIKGLVPKDISEKFDERYQEQKSAMTTNP